MLPSSAGTVNAAAIDDSGVILYAFCRMRLTKEDVLSIASLARIGMTDEEVDRAESDLGAILGYVERLQNVDTTGVPEAAAPAVEAAGFRLDEVNASTDVERSLILDNFPASEGGFLKAPAVFEKPKR